MSLAEAVRAARGTRDWQRLVQALPFANFLQLRIDVRGELLTCVLPAQERLVGNRTLPALHGGATAGFMDCAAILFLLWRTDAVTLPKAIDFNIDFLRSAKVQETFAEMHLVKLGARVANVRVLAWQTEPEKPIAIGHGNFLLAP